MTYVKIPESTKHGLHYIVCMVTSRFCSWTMLPFIKLQTVVIDPGCFCTYEALLF